MLNIKRFFSLALTAFLVVSASVAQDSGGRASNRPDLTSFKSVYGSDGLEMRRQVLKYIGETIAKGDAGDDVYTTLEYMSKEGIKNRAMIKGQLLNNYPDIRRQVAAQLGAMGTERAAGILLLMCDPNDKDLYVLWETIKSLGDIGINENDNTVKRIYWSVRGFNERPLDNVVVENVISSAIEAFDKIEKKSNGIKDQGILNEVLEFLDRVSKNERFIRRQGHVSVQEHAKLVRDDILRRDAQRKT
jgi:hypothetical protein